MLIALLERTVKMMQEETKNYLMQLVIDLHDRARLTGNQELRKIADDISAMLKRDKQECYI